MIFQIFICLAPNSTFLLHSTKWKYYNHIFLCSRHGVGGRRKKDLHNFVQLSFTKIYRHLNFMPITSSHHFVSSHHCALISPRLHRWNFPDSKQRPILSPLTLTRRTVKRFDRRLIFVPYLLDWVGRTQGKTKTLHSNPVSGRESYPLFSNTHTHTHTHTSSNASDHESAGVTSH